MVIVRVRIKNIVSNYIYKGTSEMEALYEGLLKFERIFGKGKFKFIGSAKIEKHPFPYRAVNIGIRALVNLN